MTTKKIWGPIIWTFFHTIAEKIKPEFEKDIPELFSKIKNICSYLPCPDCSRHASTYFYRIRNKKITTRNDLINFLWTFHNSVNVRLKKEVFPLEDCLKRYKKAITIKVFQRFLLLYSMNSRNSKLMMDDLHRKNIYNELNQYFKNNFHKFNP